MALFKTPPLSIVDCPADAAHHGGVRIMRDMIIWLHHTGGRNSRAWLSRTSPPSNPVSCHRLIEKDGTNVKIVDDELNAWTQGHVVLGGMNRWLERVWRYPKYWNANINGLSIELENLGDGKDPYTEPQIKTTAWQIVEWWGMYGWLPILYHGYGDPNKDDPANFPRLLLDQYIRDSLREVL